MKFKKQFFFSFIAVLLIPVYLYSAMIFKDVPRNHWAYDAIKELAERGIIEGYEGKVSSQFKGYKTLTRYEFAQALVKAIHKLEAEIGITRATGIIDEVNVNEVLTKSGLSKTDVELLKKLILEFQKELADMNLRVSEVETKQRNMELSQPKTPFYISIGAAVVSVIALIISIAK
ncbi:MAG: S-layer homology domain-containing protein [Spirochaetes bacterium]|nr:S-layer homology domain-containing protein [Spirochaetota bacterium]